MSNTGRWSLAALVVVIAMIVALWPRGAHDEPSTGHSTGIAGQQTAPADPVALAQARITAALAACPAAHEGSSAGIGPVASVTLGCLADGTPVNLASMLGGKPALLNLWAYWCAPCATELPYLQEYSVRAGAAITVLTVHSDPNEGQALARLTDLSVRLPGVEDPDGRVRAAVGAPPVLPVSVLLRADGTVAEIVAKPFSSVDEIADTVRRDLGVAA